MECFLEYGIVHGDPDEQPPFAIVRMKASRLNKSNIFFQFCITF
jgi:hypothetical protein